MMAIKAKLAQIVKPNVGKRCAEPERLMGEHLLLSAENASQCGRHPNFRENGAHLRDAFVNRPPTAKANGVVSSA